MIVDKQRSFIICMRPKLVIVMATESVISNLNTKHLLSDFIQIWDNLMFKVYV